MTGPVSHLQKVGLHLLFFLRFIQLGSVTITGFIYCYLVWHHNNHYCAYRPGQCTAEEMNEVKVPWEYIFIIAACTLAFLESYISTAFFLHRQQMPNYRSLLYTTTPVAAFFGLAYQAVYNHPSTTLYCWFNQLPTSLKSNVEKKNCVIVVDGYVSSSIAVGFTIFIFLMSAVVVVSQSVPKRIMLPIESAEANVDKEEGPIE